MIRVTVDSIRVSLLTQHRVVVLREADSQRYLPIWIGPFEADAIALAVRTDVPIYVEPHVFERAGTTADEEENTALEDPTTEENEPEATDEEGLSAFREFINTLDFDEDEGKKGKQ